MMVILLLLFILMIIILCIYVEIDDTNSIWFDFIPPIQLTNDSLINDKTRIKQQPSIIIIASINAGTSTLNRILWKDYKHFFHGFRDLQDMYYWIACTPNDYLKFIENKDNKNKIFLEIFNDIKYNKYKQFYSWNVSFSNLKYRGCNDLENINTKYHCNIKCTHNDYMQHIGFMRDKYRFNNIFVSDSDSTKSEEEEIYYFWDRTSGYNSLPYIAPILTKNYQNSKLLYIIRDPLSQSYSRIHLFDENTFLMKTMKERKQMTVNEVHQRYTKLINLIETDEYQLLISLLSLSSININQIKKNENDILIWYTALWAKYGISWKEYRWFDICPFINILLYIKSIEFVNNNINDKFKIIQFEWMTQTNHLLLTSISIYCWTVFNEYNNCFNKYTNNNYTNLNEIMINWNILNTHYGQLRKYHYKMTNITLFDKLLKFEQICDNRLLKLIEKYPIILGKFDINLWYFKRQIMRQDIVNNSIKSSPSV